MSTQVIVATITVFTAIVLLSAHIILHSNKKENGSSITDQESTIQSENVFKGSIDGKLSTVADQERCILHINGENVLIDGRDMFEFERIGSHYVGDFILLSSGTHVIEAKFSTKVNDAIIEKNRNYRMNDSITCTLELEKGYQYSLGIYFYSPSKRFNYYKGEVGQLIFSTSISVSGVNSAYSKVYVIGYKEADMEGNNVREISCPATEMGNL